MKKVGIVIINYNSEKETIACLQSLQIVQHAGLTITIYVIDNNSKEESYQEVCNAIKKLDKKIPVKEFGLKVNLGFSGGNNVGIHHALSEGADYVMILNNDTLVEPKFLEVLVAGIEKDERIGAASPKIYFAKGYEFHKDRYKTKELGRVFWYAGGSIDWNHVTGKHRGVNDVDSGQYDVPEITQFATGCCMLIRKEVFTTVGFLDESYFLYYEDADFSERIKKAGYKLFYIPAAIVWHKNAGSTGGSGSSVQDYFITRNRLHFGMTYAPLKTKVALLRESIRLLQTGRPWQKKGIKDFYMHRFGKGSYT